MEPMFFFFTYSGAALDTPRPSIQGINCLVNLELTFTTFLLVFIGLNARMIDDSITVAGVATASSLATMRLFHFATRVILLI